MTNKRPPELNGFLGEGTFFEGDLTFPDTLRIEGSFRGRIRSPEATLIIAESGKVEAEVEVAELFVAGHLSGTVRASRRLEVAAEGRIDGEVYSTNLVVRDGALIQGVCHMGPGAEPGMGQPPAGEKAEDSAPEAKQDGDSPPDASGEQPDKEGAPGAEARAEEGGDRPHPDGEPRKEEGPGDGGGSP